MAVRRSGLTSSAVGGVGSGGFHISGVASGRPRCGGGFRGDGGCTPSMGLSVDTEFIVVVRDSDCPLVWVAQKPRGGSAGPRSAGAYIGDVVLRPKKPFFVSRRTSCYRRRTTCSVREDKACPPSLTEL